MKHFHKEAFAQSLASFKHLIFKYDDQFEVLYYYGVSLLKSGEVAESAAGDGVVRPSFDRQPELAPVLEDDVANGDVLRPVQLYHQRPTWEGDVCRLGVIGDRPEGEFFVLSVEIPFTGHVDFG